MFIKRKNKKDSVSEDSRMQKQQIENKTEKFARLCRAVVPEGITLLETDGALPLQENENVAMFGRGQFEYVKSGTGSG